MSEIVNSQSPQIFGDSAPTTGVMELYKVPEGLFDKNKIHFMDNYLIVKKHVRMDVSCHGITRILDKTNRVKKRKNMVLIQGRELIADLMAGRLPQIDPVTAFSAGTGGYIGEPDPNVHPPTPSGTDTQLNAEVFVKDIDSIEKPNRSANTFIGFIDENELNGYLITEWALKTQSGLVFSRVTTKPVPIEAGFVYVVRWTIQH